MSYREVGIVRETVLFDTFNTFADAAQHAKRLAQRNSSNIRVFRLDNRWAVKSFTTDSYVSQSDDAEDYGTPNLSREPDQTIDWGVSFDDRDPDDWEEFYSGPQPSDE